MDDLSLHYIANGHLKWHLEEGLSQIKQVEVFDKATVQDVDADMPAYVSSMSDKDVTFAEVPARIIQRYLGNFEHMGNQVSALIKSFQGNNENNY